MLGDGLDAESEEAVDRSALPELTRHAAMVLLFGSLITLLTGLSFARGSHAETGVIGGCKMSWMSPHYIKLDGLKHQHSRLADKYGLYLYREAGYDRQELDGVPVLFVPGNAGSFRQVRSLASSATRQYLNEAHHPMGKFEHGRNTSHLDWFSVDFNEDFSAFHGTTLLEQSEYLNDVVAYILSLYQRDPLPSSVIMVAHSMGGISTRKMLRMPNYRSKSVNTIITLSTPHLVPPVALDHDIDHIYADINDYWRDAYVAVDEKGTRHELDDVLMVSAAGGASDTMISSDTTSLSDLVPSSHGFTIFTTTIPHLYSSVDHLAMMWCDQLRSRVARALLEIVDKRSASQVKTLEERLAVLKHQLLPTEPEQPMRMISPQFDERITPPPLSVRRNWLRASPLVLKSTEGDAWHVMQVAELGERQSLVLLTDSPSGDIGVLGCTGGPDARCASLKRSGLFSIPQSFPDRPTSNDDPLQSYLRVDLPLAEHGNISQIAVRMQSATFSFLAAEVVETASLDSVINPTLFRAFLGFRIPLQMRLVSNLLIPALDSALLVYSVSLHSDCLNSAFSPLLRAYARRNYESHWYPSFRAVKVYMHGAAPFVFTRTPQDGILQLQLWRDPTCTDQPTLQLKIDLFRSLGKSVLHYRTVFVAWPFAFALLILSRQLSRHEKKRWSFQSPSRVSGHVLRHQSTKMTGIVVVLSLLQTFLLAVSGPVTSWLSDALFGNDRFFFAIILPLCLIGIVWAFTLAVAFALQMSLHACAMAWQYGTLYLPAKFQSRIRGEDEVQQRPALWHRMVILSCLISLVTFFAPVQFVFLVLAAIQLATVARFVWLARISPAGTARHAWHRCYYHLTIILLFLLLLPLTAPILLVWSRNLLAGYYAPFSSDRNPLRIMGFLLWTDATHSGHPLPACGRALRLAQPLILMSILYILLYGIRYSYSALPLGNLIFLVLAWAHWENDF